MSYAKRTLFLWLTSALLVAGCATESIKVRVMRPAPVNLGKYDKIAVDTFTGDGGIDVADELIGALSGAKNIMTGQEDFDVLDRREVDKMLDDLKGRHGQQWNEQAMAVLNEWKNVEVTIKGDVPVYMVEETLSESNWVDNDGVLHKTYSLEAVANVTATIEATDTSSDKVFDSVKLAEVASDTSTAVDTMPQPIDLLEPGTAPLKLLAISRSAPAPLIASSGISCATPSRTSDAWCVSTSDPGSEHKQVH